MPENKRDLSLSMAWTNVAGLALAVPAAALQIAVFHTMHGAANMDIAWNIFLFFAVVILGVAVHESLHAVGWVFFGRKTFSAIGFGFNWKTITPYAHLKEPVDVGAYRIGVVMPGFVLGILPYSLSLMLGDGNIFWFGVVHTAAAGGDWAILWLIRNVAVGALVEDHPVRAGCYVLER